MRSDVLPSTFIPAFCGRFVVIVELLQGMSLTRGARRWSRSQLRAECARLIWAQHAIDCKNDFVLFTETADHPAVEVKQQLMHYCTPYNNPCDFACSSGGPPGREGLDG